MAITTQLDYNTWSELHNDPVNLFEDIQIDRMDRAYDFIGRDWLRARAVILDNDDLVAQLLIVGNQPLTEASLDDLHSNTLGYIQQLLLTMPVGSAAFYTLADSMQQLIKALMECLADYAEVEGL